MLDDRRRVYCRAQFNGLPNYGPLSSGHFFAC